MACHLRLMMLVLSSVVSSVHSSQGIPVLLWSPERSMSDIPDVSGVNPIKSDDFLNSYLAPLMGTAPESAVVFLQDKLHMDDFTKYADVYSLNSDGGAFKNIKNLMEDHFSLELPQVSQPHVAIEKLKSVFSGDVHKVRSPEDVEKLGLTTDKKFLLIVQLDPVLGQENQENAIQQNDAVIGAISRHLQKRSIKYTALYTGQIAENSEPAAVETHVNRRLMAEPVSNSNGTFMNVSNGDVYIFLREIFVCIWNSTDNYCVTNFTLTPSEDAAKNTSRDNTTATIELRYENEKPQNGTGSYTISIKTDARNLGDRWVMERMSLDVSGGDLLGNNSIENATLSRGQMDWVIPILYSWHCSDMKVEIDALHDKKHAAFKGTYVELKGYQLQPFNIQKDRFFNAQDCVPFFTIPIWMALFSSLVLLLILMFGVMMVLSLSIMDKYDDPKGKTISVAQATD